jgi:hypothetical protein
MRQPLPFITVLSLLAACGAAVAQSVSTAAEPPPPPPVPYFGKADLNGDVSLDGQDLGLFVDAWREFHETQALTTAADFDESGAIDILDAVFFIGEWLRVRQPTTAATVP